jgi:hypothetical protein
MPEQNLRRRYFETPYANQFSFLTRPSFSTAHRKRSENLSHVRKTLKPGVPVIPLRQTSFEVVGQWPVCRAVASPTEETCVDQRLSNDAKNKIPTVVGLCQGKKYVERGFHCHNLKAYP